MDPSFPVLAAALAALIQAPAAAQGGPVAIGHDDVSCVIAGRHPQVDACLTPAAAVGRAQVHFRAGRGEWYAVDLKPQGQCFRALLPRPLPTTAAVEYYVDVLDRGFAHSRRPERAPDTAYTARVVRAEGDCDRDKRVAAWTAEAGSPIVVSTVGGAPAAGAVSGAPIVPFGFSPEGVVAGVPVAEAGQPAQPKPTQGSGGIAGMSATTAAIVGGAVVVGGVALAASGGGDDSPSGGSGGSGGTGGGGGGGGGGEVNLSGNWSGPWTTTFNSPGIGSGSCTSEVALVVSHSGASFSGTGTSSASNCNIAVPGGGGVTGGGGSGTFSGTASGGRVSFTVPFGDSSCPPFQYTGTYTATQMSGTMSNTCTIEGFPLNWTGTWSATRR